MNEQNLAYLKDSIKYMGFGEKLYTELEQGLKAGQPEFQLRQVSDVSRKPFEVTLHFRKGDNADRYYFNSYHASLRQSNGDVKDQVFYLTKGKGITAKEAYNLLEGRAVQKELTTKEGASYKAWIQLDFETKDKHNNHEFKQFHEKYGYDLKEALSKFAIPEMDGGDREKALLHSLQKGNVQAVTMMAPGSITQLFVEANPQYKTVTVYDSEMKRLPKESLELYKAPSLNQGKETKEALQSPVHQETKAALTPTKGRSASL